MTPKVILIKEYDIFFETFNFDSLTQLEYTNKTKRIISLKSSYKNLV